MQRRIQLVAVIAFVLLAISIVQAYESQYNSDRQEDRKEFLRRLLNAFDQEENLDQRWYILKPCPIRCWERMITQQTSLFNKNKYRKVHIPRRRLDASVDWKSALNIENSVSDRIQESIFTSMMIQIKGARNIFWYFLQTESDIPEKSIFVSEMNKITSAQSTLSPLVNSQFDVPFWSIFIIEMLQITSAHSISWYLTQVESDILAWSIFISEMIQITCA